MSDVASAGALDALLSAYAHTTEQVAQRTVDLRIAGMGLRLLFAGRALQPTILPSLEARRCAALSVPDLTIHIFDSASTGIRPGLRLHARLGRPRSTGDSSSRTTVDVCCGATPDGNQGHVVSAADPVAGVGAIWAERAEAVPWGFRVMPLRDLLHAQLGAANRSLVHAAAVGRAGQGVLIGAPGGSGKSTLAVGAVSSGMDFLGDDYVVVEVDETVTAHNLYGTAKMLPITGVGWTELETLSQSGTGPNEEGKRILDIHGRFPDRVVADLPVRAVVVPRIVRGAATRLVPISRLETLRSMAISTIVQQPATDGRVLGVLADVVRGLPCYALELDRQPGEAVRLLDLLAKDGGAGAFDPS